MTPAEPAPPEVSHGVASRLHGLHRRPSGEPPPLPRQWDRRTLGWLAFVTVFLVLWAVVVSVPSLSRAVTIADTEITRWFSQHRGGMVDGLARVQSVLFTWLVPVVGWAALAVLIVFRRWRHALVLLTALVLSVIVAVLVRTALTRPRPLGLVIAGRWENFAQPSLPVAVGTAVLVSAGLALVPEARRRLALAVVAVAVALYAMLEIYLGVSLPTDEVVAVIIGVTVPVLVFRFAAPENVFPVGYRRGNTAHVDLSGVRGDAVRTAVEAQLGLRVVDLRPIGSPGSAGSTPMRLTTADPVTGEPGPELMAKLLTDHHLRADRWYKLGRTILYGRLEDEQRYATVKRLVQAEDYLDLRMAAAGVRVPATYGIVEITPEAEYLLVNEFIAGSSEIGDVEVDEAIVDRSLSIVRRLWDAGLAHRDVKPANLMVRGEEVVLIDMGFSEVRPSPWRQAVDLANMMMVLALRSSAELVYERTMLQFSPDDVAEAFAATKGMTVPTELRNKMKAAGVDLATRFRELAPPRAPIRIQRWSWRRVLLTIGVVLGALALTIFGIAYLQIAGMLP